MAIKTISLLVSENGSWINYTRSQSESNPHLKYVVLKESQFETLMNTGSVLSNCNTFIQGK